MSNNSIDDFKVLSPSEKKELERKRQEQECQRLEAEERARLAAEEKARKARLAAKARAKLAEDARKAKESKRAELEQSKQEKLQQLSELSNTKAVLVSIVNTIVFLGALVGIGVPIGEFDGALLFLYIMFVGVGGGFVGLFIIWGVIYDRMKEKIEKKRWALEGQIKSISNELSKLK